MIGASNSVPKSLPETRRFFEQVWKIAAVSRWLGEGIILPVAGGGG